MKGRIWELDALRGAALLGMIGIHLVYDLVDLFGVVAWQQPVWYLLFKNNYGALFLLISGISVTLGRHCLKRGLTVFCCGFLCTAATVFMYLTGLAGKDIIIYFGVLHCLGCCMLLWPVFRRSPQWLLAALGVLLVGLGLWLRGEGFSFPWLMPLGLAPWGFASSDYFPLMPNLGYFLLGAVLGRQLYPEKVSRFPREDPPLKTLQWLGRHSLGVYLLHQPLLAVLVALMAGGIAGRK